MKKQRIVLGDWVRFYDTEAECWRVGVVEKATELNRLNVWAEEKGDLPARIYRLPVSVITLCDNPLY